MSTETHNTEAHDTETHDSEAHDGETSASENDNGSDVGGQDGPVGESSQVSAVDSDSTDTSNAAVDGVQETDTESPQASEGPPPKASRREALEAEGDVAADFLEALLDIADIVGDIDVDIDGDRAAVSIVDSEEGRVPRRLVGPDGKVLEALQELTRLAVQTETGERSRLMLDVAGHRSGRRAEIVEITHGVIATVRETGEQAEMDPMTAFERKIVHDEVLAAGLRSESEGVEPRRYVVVLPAV